MRGVFAALLVLTAVAGARADTLDRIKQSGEIRIGYRVDAPPISSEDKDGQPQGYAIDLCNHIVAALRLALDKRDLAVKYVGVTAEERIDKLLAGDIDIECATTTRTFSRQAKVDFTLLTFVTGTSFLVHAKSNIHDIADLAGKKIALTAGTTNETAIKRALNYRQIKADIVPITYHDEGMSALRNGLIDALGSDEIILIGLAADLPEPYRLSRQLYSFEPYAFMVRQNDAAFRLIADRALARLYGSGEILEIYKKWLGKVSEGPSEQLNLLYQLQAFQE